jgi:MarR-like DNA-binding transcriptional regulator SgrR of sgrS sRNA
MVKRGLLDKPPLETVLKGKKTQESADLYDLLAQLEMLVAGGDETDLLTTEEAAEYLGMTQKMVYRRIYKRQLAPAKKWEALSGKGKKPNLFTRKSLDEVRNRKKPGSKN